jgi:hypothetical protein
MIFWMFLNILYLIKKYDNFFEHIIVHKLQDHF